MTRPSSLADLASIYDSQPISGMRNRIINGDMRIDQRNAGSSITAGSFTFPVDRFFNFRNSGGTITAQRSTAAPPGFNNSLLMTATSAATATAAQQCIVTQRIEGVNTYDFNLGTSDATLLTLSFWVRSSLTGTYCVYFNNNTYNRSYVTTYTINTSNTWEFKTITLRGDTTGTWVTDTNIGLVIGWSLGSGSNYNTTAGTWVAGEFQQTSTQANWCGTASATFNLTGVQLEVGPFATPFERRSFGQELMLCQRYFQRNGRVNGIWYSTNQFRVICQLPVVLRAAPVLSLLDTNGYHEFWNQAGYFGISSVSIAAANPDTVDVQITSSSNRGRAYPEPAMIERNVIGISAEL